MFLSVSEIDEVVGVVSNELFIVFFMDYFVVLVSEMYSVLIKINCDVLEKGII